MLEKILTTAAENVPSLVVLGALGYSGLKLVFAHLKERDESAKVRDDAFLKALRNMGSECHAVQRESNTALRQNAEMLGKNAEALNANTRVLAKVKVVLEQKAG